MELVIFHVGGGDDDIGPARAIMKILGPIVRLVLFDARPGSTEVSVESIKTKSGVKTDLVTIGIDEDYGRKPFYVNKFPLSSSLLPSSPLTKDEDPNYPHCRTWGENTELKSEIDVITDSIDSLVKSGRIPAPDFLSIDAQGAELRILRGARNALQSSILGLVTECEFFEIYAGQGLIQDQLIELSTHGFRLTEIYSEQRWFPGPAAGKGFLTMGESLFLKYALIDRGTDEHLRGCIEISKLQPIQIFKLALISFAFERTSYFFTLMRYLSKHHKDVITQFSEIPDVSSIFKTYSSMMNDYPKFLADRKYFLKHPPYFKLSSSRMLNVTLLDIARKLKRVVTSST